MQRNKRKINQTGRKYDKRNLLDSIRANTKFNKISTILNFLEVQQFYNIALTLEMAVKTFYYYYWILIESFRTSLIQPQVSNVLVNKKVYSDERKCCFHDWILPY
jgi:hypothetical protein